MVANICPEERHQFTNVCLARSTVSPSIAEVPSDNKRQLEVKGAEFEVFSLGCDESTDAYDIAQLLMFLKGVDSEMNVSEAHLTSRAVAAIKLQFYVPNI